MSSQAGSLHPLTLLLRSRRIGSWLAIAVAGTAVLRGLAGLATEAFTNRPDVAAAFGFYAVTIAVAAAGPGLAGHDLDLDRTAARDWRPLRLAQLVLIVTLVIGLVATAGWNDETLGPTGQIVRNTIGLTGLLALAAATLGVARSWVPAILLTVAAPFLAFRLGVDPPAWAHVITWPVEIAESRISWVMALSLALIGAGAYTLAGPRA
jgi:hypothetical protein